MNSRRYCTCAVAYTSVTFYKVPEKTRPCLSGRVVCDPIVQIIGPKENCYRGFVLLLAQMFSMFSLRPINTFLQGFSDMNIEHCSLKYEIRLVRHI